jgi:hypothetical protein
MTVAPAVQHRVIQAMIWVYKSGLTAPETFAYPLADEGRGTAPAKPADVGDTDAPPAGGGSAG